MNNQMIPYYIITWLGVAGFISIVLTFPIRARFIIRKAGDLIVPIKKKTVALPLMIVLFSAFLLVILFFKQLSIFVALITMLVAVLGAAIGTQELALHDKCGLYQNGLVGATHYLPVKEIYGIEELGWSKEEREEHSSNVIHIITDKKGMVPFICEDEEQTKKVLAALVEICPALNQNH